MTKEIWINLPVKNINKSKEFFSKLGFSLNSQYNNTEESACLVIGEKNLIVMLFIETTFQSFTGNKISDSKLGTEVLFSIGAESRDEVDEMAENVVKAGGKIYAEAGDTDGWMYGCGFVDLDGHRWNIVYMDMSKMP